MDREASEPGPGSTRATDGAVGDPPVRTVLGTIRLELRKGEVGRLYYLAQISIDCIALLETPPGAEAPDGSSKSLREWRRRESNPRPRMGQSKRLRAYCPVAFAAGHGQDTADPELATGKSHLRRGSATERPARTVVASRSRIGRDFSGDGPRQGSTLRSHRHVGVGVCQVPGWISEIPGISARSFNLAKHVETVTPPVTAIARRAGPGECSRPPGTGFMVPWRPPPVPRPSGAPAAAGRGSVRASPARRRAILPGRASA